MLVVPREFRSFEYSAMAIGLKETLPSLEDVLVVGGDDPTSAFESKYREIIGYTNSHEAVSTDFYSSPFATIIDSQATIAEGKQITLYCWYDNEFGYSKQVLNLTKKISSIELTRFPLPIE